MYSTFGLVAFVVYKLVYNCEHLDYLKYHIPGQCIHADMRCKTEVSEHMGRALWKYRCVSHGLAAWCNQQGEGLIHGVVIVNTSVARR